MSYLVLDVESTTKNKGHPFTPSNKLCAVGLRSADSVETYKIQYDDAPFGSQLDNIRRSIDRAGVIVGFNLKFDLHWLRRYGINLSGIRVHDCQLAYFIQRCQEVPYPSLNEAAEYYGFEPKLDVVEKEYWSRGIDTTGVPWETLVEYLHRDLELTEQVYHRQLEWFGENPKLAKLLELQCRDLLVLEEMEWNGLLYDRERSLEKAKEVEEQSAGIIKELNNIIGADFVNWNSTDHVSAVLYGGTIKEAVREPYLFYYKDTKREPVWKTRTIIKEHNFPRLCEPLPNTQLAKEGLWSTSMSILHELKTNSTGQNIIALLSKLSALGKKHDYLAGIPELMQQMEWEDGILHGNLNQCRVITGRLSSDKPNQQNMPEEVQELILTRWSTPVVDAKQND